MVLSGDSGDFLGDFVGDFVGAFVGDRSSS